ncbi:MAG TPA: DUF5666 domain-containing protein [Dehalococcoidia bacterium]|nr:DUF5666 domain-containing protein [Dehalococcoidia bacterium]
MFAAAALLGGVVITGVLAGPGGLMAGSGSRDSSGDRGATTADATATPEPTAVETVGDVITCPTGENTRFKFEQNGSEFELTGTLVSLDQSAIVVTGPDGDVTAAMAVNTEVKGNPQPGDAVKVEGAVLDDGTFVAREVKPACEEAEPTATPTPEPTATPPACLDDDQGEDQVGQVEKQDDEADVEEQDEQDDDGDVQCEDLEDENEDENDDDQDDSGDHQDAGQHHDDSSEGHEDSGEHNSGSED